MQFGDTWPQNRKKKKKKKKPKLNGYAYNFSVDYDAIAVADILDIQKYLMKKWDSIKCLDLQSNYLFWK